jgi:UDPglucose 6-dehydrogenase
VVTSNENAEIIKYASNAFLATKISFINQIADLCEKIDGSDVQVVARGMGLDHRIGKDFLKAGLGYGGSCFPKDTAAISAFAKERGVDLSIVDAVIAYNESRVENLAGKILRVNGPLKGKKVCVLGLSFKDNTDDLRESRSLALVNELQKKGAIISVYDPVVKNHGCVNVCSTVEACISSADIVVTATEWKEFADIEPEMLANKKIFDLRRVFDNHKVKVTMGVGIGKN